MNQKISFPKNPRTVLMIAAAVIIVILLVFAFAVPAITGKRENQYVVESDLIEAVNVSKLSTVDCIYRGISEKKGLFGNRDYLAKYKAHVYADFDMSDIGFEINEEDKHIVVTLPKPDIRVVLDENDFMFLPENASGNISDVIRMCKQDVEEEVATKGKIEDTAYGSIKDTVRWLIEPLVGDAYNISFFHSDDSGNRTAVVGGVTPNFEKE